VLCSNCGQLSDETNRFCAKCGSKLLIDSSNDHTEVSGSSFEDLLSSKMRETRIKNDLNEVSIQPVWSLRNNVQQPIVQRSKRSKKVVQTPYLFSTITFGVGSILMTLGYFVLPFAYVLIGVQGNYGFSNVKFEWRLHSVAELLRERTDENYVFGPALAFLVGGHLWTLLFAFIITVLSIFALGRLDPTEEGYVERAASQSSFARMLGRISIVLMALIFTWQVTGMFTLQRAADVSGGLSGQESLSYFSLGLGSVVSLLGISAFIFGGASLVNRASESGQSK